MGCTQSKHDIENGANDREPHTHTQTQADDKHKDSDKGRHSKTGKKHGKHHTHAHHPRTHHALSPQKARASFTGTHTNPMDPRTSFTNNGTSTVAANTSTNTSASTKTESAPLSPSPPPLSPTPSASVAAPVAAAGPPSLLSPSSLLAVSSPVSNNAPPASPTGPATAPLTPHNSLTHNPPSLTHTQEDNRSVDERSDRSGLSGPPLSVSQHEQFRRKHYDELSKSTRSKNNILSVRGGRGGVRRPSAGSRETSTSLPPTHSLSVAASGGALSLGSASYDSHADASPSSLANSEKSDVPQTSRETSSRHAYGAQTEERALSRPPLDTRSLTHSHNISSHSIDEETDTLTDTQSLAEAVTEATGSYSPATCEAPSESVLVSVPVSTPVPVPVCESPKQQPSSSLPHRSESAVCDVLSPHVTLREKQRESMRLSHTHTLSLAHNAPVQTVPTQHEITPHHTSPNALSSPLVQVAEECEGAVCEREEQTVSVRVETVSVRETLTDTELSHTTTTMTTTTETVRVLHTLTQSPPRSRTHSHTDINTIASPSRSRTPSQSLTDAPSPRSPPRETATTEERDGDTQGETDASPMKLFSKDMITTSGRARTAEQAQHEADKLRHFQRLGSATVVSNGSTPNRDISRSLSSTLLGRPHPGRGGRGFSHSHSMHVPHAQAQKETSAPTHNAPTQSLFSRSLPASPATSTHSLSRTQPLSHSDDAAEHPVRPLTLSLPHRARAVAAHNAPSQEVVEETLSHSQRVGIAQRHEPISEAEVECESDEKETSAKSEPTQEVVSPVLPLATQPAPTKSSLLLAQPRSVVTQQINAQHSQSFHNLPHTPAHTESESVRAESSVGATESAVRAESDKACENETLTHTHTQSVKEKEPETEITFADVYAPRGREKSRPSSRKSVVLSSAAVKQKEKDRASPTQHIQTQAQLQAETRVESTEGLLQSLSPALSLSEDESAKVVCEQAPEPAPLTHSTEAPQATVSATAEPDHTPATTTEPALTPIDVSSVVESVANTAEPVLASTKAARKPRAASETDTTQPTKDTNDSSETALAARTVASSKQPADTATGRQNMRAFWAAKEKERERERDRRAPLSPTASMNAATLSSVNMSFVSTLSSVSVSEKETNVLVSSTSVSENVSQRETVSDERVVIETESTAQNARRFFLQQQLHQQKSSSRPGSDNFNKPSSVRGRGNAVR